MNTQLMNRAADNLRVLIARMVETAKSGHPGGAMGGADFANVLYSSFLVYDPEDPAWFARDRFFMDPGHMSPMLYSVLALTGKYTMADLQQFRQWGSVTPGHPELDPGRGVENASGPLGQGHVMAVGCAIAERFLVNRFGNTIAHKTYAYISDGGIQEEISQGAGRIAGSLGLHNLIMFYDSNDVQLSTKVHEVTCEDTASKYRAWNWYVIEIDATDPIQIADALQKANAETERPTLIIGYTVMARKVVAADGTSLEGAVSTHGQPLSKAGADLESTIKKLGGDPENPWAIWNDVQELYDNRREELKKIAADRKAAHSKWEKENPEKAAELNSYIAGKLPDIDWNSIPFKTNAATRATSGTILNILGQKVGNMIVSSADLANSDKTDGFLKATGQFKKDNYGGGFVQAGVSELTMACLMNGIVLHGGMRAACGTFFVFSDYEKPAIRMAALMELPVIYIFTHDAFRVGEDGPTHQPVEHEAQIRLLEQMKNLSGKPACMVLRPADSAETVAAYKTALENTDSPTVLIFSRQDLEDIPGENRRQQAMQLDKGAYIVEKTGDEPKVVLLGSGSEVSLLVHVAEKLKEEGIASQVVSMPSEGIFMAQTSEYQNKVLPPNVKLFGLTAGLPATFYPVMRGDWEVKGLNRFGASAPAKVLDEKFGFTVDQVLADVKAFLAKPEKNQQ